MTPDDRARVLVAARLLRATGVLSWLAAGLCIVSAAALLFGGGGLLEIGVLLIGAIALYYGIRVALDARLFEDIAAERLTTLQLDRALGTLRKTGAERSWEDRCRGARRLVTGSAVATIAQVLLIACSRWIR